MDRKGIEEIRGMIQAASSVLERLENDNTAVSAIEMLLDSSEGINAMLYYSKELEFQAFYDLSTKEGLEGYIREYHELIRIWEESLSRREGIDEVFFELYDYFKYVSADRIFQVSIAAFKQQEDDLRSILINGLENLIFLNSTINEETEDYSLIREYVEMMKERVEDFRWLYENLADYRSKRVLLRIVKYWINLDLRDLINLRENIFSDYYDLDLLDVGDEEVVVDCGAYIGDSIQEYIDNYGYQYKKIYAYEMSPDVFEALKQETADIPNIVYRKAGVGAKNCQLYLKNQNYLDAASLSEEGEVAVDVVPLDEDITEKITIIKMDIEGAEMDALFGAKKHIQEDKPRLLISAYHRTADIFDIPRRIREYRDDYQLYLRFNGKVAWPADFIIFGV